MIEDPVVLVGSGSFLLSCSGLGLQFPAQLPTLFMDHDRTCWRLGGCAKGRNLWLECRQVSSSQNQESLSNRSDNNGAQQIDQQSSEWYLPEPRTESIVLTCH